MKLRRSFLYMPGTDRRKIEKAAQSLNTDCICMDLEDGVALNRKAEAREIIGEALDTLPFGRSEKLVRINGIDTSLAEADLTTILPHQPDGIVIPKVQSKDQVEWVDDHITTHELETDLEPGKMHLFAMIESAAGVVNLREICSASPRLVALIFGAEDFASDIGAVRTPTSMEVLYARSAVVTYAGAHQIQAIDMVYTDFRDIPGLREQAVQGMRMGYQGKQLIHPNQIEPVHKVYAPSDSEIIQAINIVKAYQKHVAEGTGAFALDGKMVDMPVIKAAYQVLERARTSGVDIEIPSKNYADE